MQAHSVHVGEFCEQVVRANFGWCVVHTGEFCGQENCCAGRRMVRANLASKLCMQENSVNRIIMRARFGE